MYTVKGLQPDFKYLYKYVINDEWKEDLTAPTDESQKVNICVKCHLNTYDMSSHHDMTDHL